MGGSETDPATGEVQLDKLTEWSAGWLPMKLDPGSQGHHILVKEIPVVHKRGNEIENIVIRCEANLDLKTIEFTWHWNPTARGVEHRGPTTQ